MPDPYIPLIVYAAYVQPISWLYNYYYLMLTTFMGSCYIDDFLGGKNITNIDICYIMSVVCMHWFYV